MFTKKLILLYVAILAGAIVAWGVATKISLGKQETSIEASYLEMQNAYAMQIVQVLKGKWQVVDTHKQNLLDVVKANMERYSNDQGLLFKSISEQANLTLTSELYEDLSKSYKTAYTIVQEKQSDKIDKARVYKNAIENSISGWVWAGYFGYPKPETKKMIDFMLSNLETAKVFQTGMMEDIRQK